MVIGKGTSWGRPGSPLPDDGVVVSSDAEARAVLETARREGRPFPTLGLLGGDLCRTVGGTGDEAHLRSDRAVAFPVDLGQVLIDGRLHLFLAHLVARTRLWRRTLLALNAQWLGPWNVGPRSHPNDGKLDVYEADLQLGDLRKVRARLPAGAHLPHPRITSRRVAAVQLTLPKPLPIRLDGEVVGEGRDLSIRVEPDALTIVI